MFRNWLPVRQKKADERAPASGLDAFFESWFPFQARPFLPSVFTPAAEVREVKEGLEYRLELPGMDEKDIEVSVREDILTIKGEKRQEETRKEGKAMVSETRYGSFQRSFRLPPGADPDRIKARCKKGVLTLAVPVAVGTAAQVKKISIAVK